MYLTSRGEFSLLLSGLGLCLKDMRDVGIKRDKLGTANKSRRPPCLLSPPELLQPPPSELCSVRGCKGLTVLPVVDKLTALPFHCPATEAVDDVSREVALCHRAVFTALCHRAVFTALHRAVFTALHRTVLTVCHRLLVHVVISVITFIGGGATPVLVQ